MIAKVKTKKNQKISSFVLKNIRSLEGVLDTKTIQ